MPLLTNVDRLARTQHGVVTRRDLFRLGVTKRQIENWLARDLVFSVHPGVYRLAGVPVTWHQRQLAAVLATPEGAASHRAAAFLWGLLPEEKGEVVELTSPYARSPKLSGVKVHRSLDLRGSKTSLRNGIPTTNPLRTMVDLGAVLGPPLVSDCLERGLTDRLFSLAAVDAERIRLARRGRRGAGVMRTILDERALGSTPADGLLEVRMAALFRDYSLPEPVFQYVLGPWRLDFAYPWRLVAIEVDGWSCTARRRPCSGTLNGRTRSWPWAGRSCDSPGTTWCATRTRSPP
jgi:hypothetical protein